MKSLIVLTACLFSFSVSAVDDAVFSEKYPGIKEYQNIGLQGLNLYFFTFMSRSVLFKNDLGSYQIEYQDNSGNTILSLKARIERKTLNGELQEYVQYVLPNANVFDFYLKKTGLDQSPTPDNDLLTMNFKKQTSNYEIGIVPLMTVFNKTGIKDFLVLGFMEVNISIQTLYKENEATRSYIYFFRGMPNPQSSLTVQVIGDPDSFNTYNYIHSSKGAEISPKYFFQGLQEGSMIFQEFSQISLLTIKNLGFPSIEGIN
jgi:hypothetical protein